MKVSSNTAKALLSKAKASATATKSSARRCPPRLSNDNDDGSKSPSSEHCDHSNQQSGGGGLPSGKLKKSKRHGNGPSDDPSHRFETAWQENYRQLVAYKRKHGHCNVPNKYKSGRWASQMRDKFKKNKLSEDHIRLLTKIGFQLCNVDDERWMKRYRELVAYKEKHGNCRVPH